MTLKLKFNIPIAHSRPALTAILCASALAEFVPQASADEFFTVPAGLGNSAGYTLPQSFGDQFTPLENLTVSEVGFWDPTGTGLNESHVVGIFNSSGALLESGVVPVGTTGAWVDGFRYVAIAPLTLDAGQTYTLAATLGLGTIEDGVGYTSPAGVNLSSEISTSSDPSRYIFAGDASDLVYPTGPGVSASFYVGPNFEFSGNSSSAPDGGSTALMVSLGFAAVAGIRRKLA
jgi:hypothetical protein